MPKRKSTPSEFKGKQYRVRYSDQDAQRHGSEANLKKALLNARDMTDGTIQSIKEAEEASFNNCYPKESNKK